MRGRMCGNKKGGHHKGRSLGCLSEKGLGNAANVDVLDSRDESPQPSWVETASDTVLKSPKKLKVAKVDTILCKGCEVCIRFCKKGAISMVEGRAHVDEAKCVGCGACVKGCKNSAIKLVDRL
jgi:MinD superfamily P-loop ATPase